MKLRRFSLLAMIAMVATLLAPVSVPPAAADGTPDIAVSKSMPDQVLLGENIPVTLTLTNPGGPDGYNATFNDTLPAGVGYVPGSASPDPLVLPQGDGTTVLVWKNVADILTNSTVELNYSIATDASYDSGDTVTNSANAYANSSQTPRRTSITTPALSRPKPRASFAIMRKPQVPTTPTQERRRLVLTSL